MGKICGQSATDPDSNSTPQVRFFHKNQLCIRSRNLSTFVPQTFILCGGFRCGFRCGLASLNGFLTKSEIPLCKRGLRVCSHSVFGCWMDADSESNLAPITAVFSLPFFGMEIPQVSIDQMEFFHVFFKTVQLFPKNGHINSWLADKPRKKATLFSAQLQGFPQAIWKFSD